jgi:hypothetical protein
MKGSPIHNESDTGGMTSLHGRKPTSKVFDDLMTGLDEVDAFLAGETAGYNVSRDLPSPGSGA